MFLKEIIFEKAARNLKKVIDRIQNGMIPNDMYQDDVLILAIGGYLRTPELLRAIGADFATFDSLSLNPTFLRETHGKDVLLVNKVSYITGGSPYNSVYRRQLDYSIADAFEARLSVYCEAERKFRNPEDKQWYQWRKPTVVVLDDVALNLQTDGFRFSGGRRIGFVQFRNRTADPETIITDANQVKPADHLMFCAYQKQRLDEKQLIQALASLHGAAQPERLVDDKAYYFKPTEFKRTVGDPDIAKALQVEEALGIEQFSKNKRLGSEVARWVVVPKSAFDFSGFDYLDEQEAFEAELQEEEAAEAAEVQAVKAQVDEIMSIPLHLSLKQGWQGNSIQPIGKTNLDAFLSLVEQDEGNAITYLDEAKTENDYKNVKAHYLDYFIDGQYAHNERKDANYQGGKRLVSIDLDTGGYTREDVEDKLTGAGLFGLVYPTPKFYWIGEPRWRIVLVASRAIADKAEYKATVEHAAQLLHLEDELDPASKKLSQLMGTPLKREDVSVVPGTLLGVAAEKPEGINLATTTTTGVEEEKRSIADFNHPQALLLRQAIHMGVPKGSRNESYYQIYKYLTDTLDDPSFEAYHAEAAKWLNQLDAMMARDGLPQSEREKVMRCEN